MTPAAQPWSALWFLYSRSWKNRILQHARRLRQPRYIVGALAMGFYIYSMMRNSMTMMGPTSSEAAGMLDTRELFAILSLLVALVTWWVAAPSENALAYSPAEVFFLFPAPVNRRTLVQARLFSVQAGLLIQVLIWTLVLRRQGGELPGVLRALGLWLIFTTVSLHRLGATLSRTRAPDAPPRRPVARVLALTFFGALAAAIAFATPAALTIWRGEIAIADSAEHVLSRFASLRIALQTVVDAPAVSVLLWPIRAITAPAFAPNPLAWLFALPAAIAVLAAHYLWIVRDPQPFEELALGATSRFAEHVARLRRGSAPINASAVGKRWRLATTGNPAVALAWKNTTATLRTFRPRAAIIILVAVAAILLIALQMADVDSELGAIRTAFATTLVGTFAMAVLMAPGVFRNDLRHDLAHLAFLKTVPLPAHTIVATEILTAAAITTVSMTALFAVPGFYLIRSIGGPLTSGGIVLAIAGGAVLLGVINLLHITLHNAVALWLPDWVPLAPSGNSTGGASVVGQVYISLLAILTALGVLLLAPTAGAAGVWWLLRDQTSVLVAGGTALLAGSGLAVVEWLGLSRVLGRALDALEPSDVSIART